MFSFDGFNCTHDLHTCHVTERHPASDWNTVFVSRQTSGWISQYVECSLERFNESTAHVWEGISDRMHPEKRGERTVKRLNLLLCRKGLLDARRMFVQEKMAISIKMACL